MIINIIGSDAERRAGLKTLLRRVARQAQFIEAKDWRQARSTLKRSSPDMIVIDWAPELRTGDLQILLDDAPDVPAAIMVDRCGAALVYALMSVGVMGVIPRALDPILILRALEMVLVGGHYIPPDVVDPELTLELTTRRIRDSVRLPHKIRHRPTLSPRQQQIMRCVHIASIFQQLGATNRAAAVAIYNGVQNTYLEILRCGREKSAGAVSGQPGVIPLRRPRTRYPSLLDNDAAALPMAAEPESTF
jgi:DNA-binding NarL/FixJ family response regulator